MFLLAVCDQAACSRSRQVESRQVRVAEPGSATSSPAQATLSPPSVTVPIAASVPSQLPPAPGSRDRRCTTAKDHQAFVERPSAGTPASRNVLRSFCLGITPVTVAEYRRCATDGVCAPLAQPTSDGGLRGCNWTVSGRDAHPANCVTYSQANDFCRWSNGRLPTWHEWHWVVVGPAGRRFPWGSEAPGDQLCWSGSTKRNSTCPVAAFPHGDQANGIYDLVGNVAEWTATLSHRSGTPLTGGSSWSNDSPAMVEPTIIADAPKDTIWHGYGFRCATDAAELPDSSERQ